MAQNHDLLSDCFRQEKPREEEEEEEERPSLRDKPLHRMYHQQREDVADKEKTYSWLRSNQGARKRQVLAAP